MSEAAEVKLFGKWSLEDVEINDIALEVRLRCPSDALTDGAGDFLAWKKPRELFLPWTKQVPCGPTTQQAQVLLESRRRRVGWGWLSVTGRHVDCDRSPPVGI